MSDNITIEVAYAVPERQTLLTLSVAKDTTIEQAIVQSGILAEHEEIDLSVNKVGIWSKSKKLDEVLSEGDRIEIYRPLIADPKEVRRKRAEKAKEV